MSAIVAHVRKLTNRVKQLGWREAVWRVYRTREYSYLFANEVGRDKYGNIYYEAAPGAVFARTRWVWYNSKEYDGSHVPAEWHAWMHYITDAIPTKETVGPFVPTRYGIEHKPNLTGTSKAYSPPAFLLNSNYQPVKQPIEGWEVDQAVAKASSSATTPTKNASAATPQQRVGGHTLEELG